MNYKVICPALMLSIFVIQSACTTKSDSTTGRSPYVGLENREIKALSETEIANYLSGAGMGFAMAAELNGYPGPKHVLELGTQIGLTKAQIDKVTGLYNEMHDDATALGIKIIETERHINMMFASAHATSENLENMLGEVGLLKSRLRFVHLRAHLQMMDILDPEQVENYIQLRGYSMPDGMDHDNMKHSG